MVSGNIDNIGISDLVLRHKERDIIKVTYHDGEAYKEQPFYRSTGKNSKKAGEWLPFSGILAYEDITIWFDKSLYIKGYSCKEYQVPSELHRYGTEQLREISDMLHNANIPEGEEATAEQINEWLGYPANMKRIYEPII